MDNVFVAPSYLTIIATNFGPTMSQAPPLQQSNGSHGQSSYLNGGYKSFNRNKGKGKFNQGQRLFNLRPQLYTQTYVWPT